jgi:hypothetical protein
VQVPAQPLLRTPSFVDEVVAVIDQELQLTQPLLTRTRVTVRMLRALERGVYFAGQPVAGEGFSENIAPPRARRSASPRRPRTRT